MTEFHLQVADQLLVGSVMVVNVLKAFGTRDLDPRKTQGAGSGFLDRIVYYKDLQRSTKNRTVSSASWLTTKRHLAPVLQTSSLWVQSLTEGQGSADWTEP